MSSLSMMEVFADLSDTRRGDGQRHAQSLCLALFTLAICSECRGFLSIGDWIESYQTGFNT